MGTYIKTVDPNGGKNFTSIAAWEADVQDDHSTAGDIEIADCYMNGGTQDTTVCTIYGWNAGVIPKVIANSAYRPTHNSTTWVGYVLTLDPASGCLRLAEPNIEIDGLIVRPAAGKIGIENGGGNLITASNVYIKNCILDGAGTSTGRGIDNSGAGIFNVYNCLAIGFAGGSGGYGFNCNHANATLNAYNCSADNCRYGFVHLSGTAVARNCMGTSCTAGAWTGTWAGATDKNISYDNTAPGTNTLKSKTTYASYFTDRTTGNLHLLGTTANGGVFGATGLSGDDLSGTFTTDIDGTTRSAWDIGFDEYTAGTATSPVRKNRTQINIMSMIGPGLFLAGIVKNPKLTRRDLFNPFTWIRK